MNESKRTISSDTIARTIVLVLALLNQILAIAGHSVISFAESDIYQLVSLLWTIAASIAAWWKNNSFTCLACQADEWMRQQQKEKTQTTGSSLDTDK